MAKGFGTSSEVTIPPTVRIPPSEAPKIIPISVKNHQRTILSRSAIKTKGNPTIIERRRIRTPYPRKTRRTVAPLDASCDRRSHGKANAKDPTTDAFQMDLAVLVRSSLTPALSVATAMPRQRGVRNLICCARRARAAA